MIKKLLPLVALSASAQASLIPYNLEINQYQDSNLVEVTLEDTLESINTTQLYLQNEDIFFRDLNLINKDSERFKLFTNSMRMYDTNSDDNISFSFQYRDIIESFNVGIGYYDNSSYMYDKHTFQVQQILPEETISIDSPSFGIGLLSVGLCCLYRNQRDKTLSSQRKVS